MHFQYSSYILPLIAATLISFWVAVYAWSRRATPSAIALALMALAIAEWSLGYILEIAGTDLATKIFWGKLQYIGIATLPLFWVVFAFNHANQGNRLTHRRMFMLAAVPVITIVLALTTEMHGLIWSEIHINRADNFSALGVSYGGWFWVHFAYSYILLAAGTFIILRSIGRMQGLYRGQTVALIISVLAPWIGNILYFSGLSPIPNLDPTPFAFTITVAGLAWGIFGFRLADIAPVARDIVVESMREGMIVLDSRGHIADINPAAARMIGVPGSQAIGKTIGDVLAPWPHLLERFQNVVEASDEITVGTGEAQRRYEVRISPLQDRQNHLVGRVISVRGADDASIPQPRFAVREPVARPLVDDLPGESEGVSPVPGNFVWSWLVNFFAPPVKKDLVVPKDTNPVWVQTIERAFTVMLRIVSVLGTVTVAITLPTLNLNHGLFAYAVSIIGVVVVFWGLGLARGLPFRLRTSLFLFIIYVLAFFEMFNFGYSVESFVYFISIVVLGVLLEDLYGGLWALAVSLVTMGIFGWLVSQGLHRPPGVSEANILPSSFQGALISITVYLASAGALVTAINTLMRSLNRAWQKEIQALNLLQQERDLLEQRVAERTRDLAEAHAQAIKRNNELRKYFLAIEQSGNTIVITDTKGTIEYANPKFEALTGYSRAEAVGGNPRVLKSGEHDRAFYKNLWDTIGAGNVWHGEFHNRRKDGTLFWESATIAPLINEEGVITNYVAVKEDISAIKQTQEALALSRDQAQEASRLKSQLLAKVSHELRTPLGSILGYAELLQIDTFGPLNEEQKDAAAQIVDSAGYLDRMINELLDQAQIEARTVILRVSSFSPASLLQKVEANMSVLARNKGLDFSASLAPDVPEMLVGDEHRLQQILINLTGNAIKYTREGRVSISIYRPDPAHWAMKISDTGAGIPKEAQSYIFEPFRQVDNSITRENRGTGLGLSITKQLVELMEGQIAVYSEVDLGSTFTVVLPIVDNPKDKA